MSEDKKGSTRPESEISKHSLDPSAVIQRPKPVTQPNQGAGNQQSSTPTSSEGKSKE